MCVLLWSVLGSLRTSSEHSALPSCLLDRLRACAHVLALTENTWNDHYSGLRTDLAANALDLWLFLNATRIQLHSNQQYLDVHRLDFTRSVAEGNAVRYKRCPVLSAAVTDVVLKPKAPKKKPIRITESCYGICRFTVLSFRNSAYG